MASGKADGGFVVYNQNGLVIERYGKLVVFRSNGYGLTSNIHDFQIPEGCRPINEVVSMATVFDGSSYNPYPHTIKVKTDGTVKLCNTTGGETGGAFAYGAFNVSWLCA